MTDYQIHFDTQDKMCQICEVDKGFFLKISSVEWVLWQLKCVLKPEKQNIQRVGVYV